MQAPDGVTGSCLCGEVSLHINALDRDVVACHCRQCRKQTGHYVAATRAKNEQLSISGEEHLTWYRASAKAERGFCRHCGSLLLWRQLGSQHTSIMAGCLDKPTGLAIACHIYVDDKGDYYDISPDVPCYAAADH